ncbi:MAG: hypothetical protein LBL90_12085 [Prevotellaceae bacterium]|jgi:hypothetical protein|nr:hypothetical protein [Prevotellaceae bacterium]
MFGISKNSNAGIWLAVLFLLSFANLNAQRLPKYENVYKDAMAANNKAFAYSLFSEYLALDSTSTRANLYFQIGILAYDLSQAFDPVAQYDDYMAYVSRADSSLKLCLQYLNEVEVKRDNDLFTGVQAADKKLTVTEVYDYVDKIIEDNKQQCCNISKIHDAYMNLSENYINCQNLYKDLCRTHTSVKQIYLMPYENVDIYGKLEGMRELLDLTDEYLDTYKSLLEKMPVKGYNNVEVTKAKIEIFRVDGLSTADFRNRETTIWDYRQWADYIMENIDGFVMVYQEIINAGNALSRRINSFNTNRTLSDTYTAYAIDDDILDSLNNYAYYPALNRYITYKEEKLNFLTKSRRKINSADYDNNGKLDMKNKLFYYDGLQMAYNSLEHMRLDLATYTTSTDTTDLIAMTFHNKADFEEYLNDEHVENGLEMNNAFENLNRYCIKKENYIRRTNYVAYKKQDIPLFLGNGFYRSTQPQNYVTKCIELSNNGIYLAGSYIGKEGFATAYIALCSPDTSNVVWLKTVDIGKVVYDNCATALYPTFDGGCFVLVIAKNVSDPELMYSTVIQYNAKGNEVKRLTLPEKTLGIGRYIAYDEVNEQLLLAFYGKEEFWYTPGAKLVIQKINLDNTILMQAEIILNGELIKIIPVKNNSLLVIGNYFSIINEKDTEYTLELEDGSMQSNVFTALFSEDGKLLIINRHAINGGSGYAIEAVKINNDTINIVGQKGQARKDSTIPFTPSESIYLSVDAEGKLLYSNQKLKVENDTR